eukprot:TRINITY_DN27241_c0_g1_i1.p1 TRINITY_DN27241_c0_g1~~TRINITY_DN27241_c0_g1_i1.p1  ORF type:complete len:589 (+),score=41.20 TRINITY_DN27241_c0_g1_i1:279-2045(+)
MALYIVLFLLTHNQHSRKSEPHHSLPVHLLYSDNADLKTLRGEFPTEKTLLRFYGSLVVAVFHTTVGALSYIDSCFWSPTQRFTCGQYIVRFLCVFFLFVSFTFVTVQTTLDGYSLSRTREQHAEMQPPVTLDNGQQQITVLPAVYCCSIKLPDDWVEKVLLSTYSCFYSTDYDMFVPPGCVERLEAWWDQKNYRDSLPSPPTLPPSPLTPKSSCNGPHCFPGPPGELGKVELPDSGGGVSFGGNFTEPDELHEHICKQTECIRDEFVIILVFSGMIVGLTAVNFILIFTHWVWGRTECPNCKLVHYIPRGPFFNHVDKCPAEFVCCKWCGIEFRRLMWEQHDKQCHDEHQKAQQEFDANNTTHNSSNTATPSKDTQNTSSHPPSTVKSTPGSATSGPQPDVSEPPMQFPQHQFLPQPGDNLVPSQVSFELMSNDGLPPSLLDPPVADNTNEEAGLLQNANNPNKVPDNVCCYCGATLDDPAVKHQHLLTRCNRFLVACQYCQHAMPYKAKAAHLLICPLRPVPCDFCGERVLMKDIGTHLQCVCEWRITRCHACGEEMCHKDFDDPAVHPCGFNDGDGGERPQIVEF